MPKKFQLSKYRKAAEKSPFVLEVDEETSISVDPPRAKNIIKLSKIDEGDLEGQLKLIAGDAYDALMEVVADESFDVLEAILKDMMDHFGMDQGESDA